MGASISSSEAVVSVSEPLGPGPRVWVSSCPVRVCTDDELEYFETPMVEPFTVSAAREWAERLVGSLETIMGTLEIPVCRLPFPGMAAP